MPPREAPLRVRKLRRKVELPEWCEARVTTTCTPSYPQPARHRHHRKRRQHDPRDESVIGVCSICHMHIHDHPAESYPLELLLHSWDPITPYVPWWAPEGDAA
jgi:hypothetical protein